MRNFTIDNDKICTHMVHFSHVLSARLKTSVFIYGTSSETVTIAPFSDGIFLVSFIYRPLSGHFTVSRSFNCVKK